MSQPVKLIAIAVIYDGDRVLVQRRPESAELGGLWEFPGGKVEAGESAETAAARECLEELGVPIEITGRLAPVVYNYETFGVELAPVLARLRSPRETAAPLRDDLRWVTLDELNDLPIPDANHRILDMLRRQPAPGSKTYGPPP
jgi:mutator protein MutT